MRNEAGYQVPHPGKNELKMHYSVHPSFHPFSMPLIFHSFSLFSAKVLELMGSQRGEVLLRGVCKNALFGNLRIDIFPAFCRLNIAVIHWLYARNTGVTIEMVPLFEVWMSSRCLSRLTHVRQWYGSLGINPKSPTHIRQHFCLNHVWVRGKIAR